MAIARWVLRRPPRLSASAPPASVQHSEAEPLVADAALDSEIRAARGAYTDAVSASIKRAVLGLIAERTEASYSTRLTIDKAPGLAELAREDIDIRKARSESLQRLLGAMGGGSVGVAGPRGVGKTTLLEAFRFGSKPIRAEITRPPLSVFVSAPVAYNGREFVLHLFAELCEAVLASAGVSRSFTPGRDDEAVLRRALPLVGILIRGVVFVGLGLLLLAVLAPNDPRKDDLAIAITVLGIGLAAVSPYSFFATGGFRPMVPWPFYARPLPRERDTRTSVGALIVDGLALRLPAWLGLAAVYGGAALLALALTHNFPSELVLWPSVALVSGGVVGGAVVTVSRHAFDYRPFDPGFGDPLVPVARQWLERMRFQQRYTTGWSGGLRLPVGAEAGRFGGKDITEQQLTLPGAVEALRRFITQAARDRDIVIAIDELDKMESGKAANRFLNDIKAVFGIEGCFYLVSVSEDAMSQFERRGTSVRDVLDSSFDEVFHLDYLKIYESRKVLGERVIRLPVPFLFLTHVFSGGLPRDLIRATRILMDVRSRAGRPIQLNEACLSLVVDDLVRKARATAVVARASSLEPHTSRFLRWLDEGSGPEPTAKSLLSTCRSLGDFIADRLPGVVVGSQHDKEARKGLVDLTVEFALVTYFAATALEFFLDSLTADELRGAERGQGNRSAIDVLARARQTFSVNRRNAWGLVCQFRREIGLSESISFPAE
jgi:hypothetical protein